MNLVSVNVSTGRTVSWQGRTFETGIFKEPVSGPVLVRTQNLEGDRQCDLTVHGGEFKAVYGYSADYYPWWERELGRDLGWGMFGENLTIEGLDDRTVCVGDVFSVGEAKLQAVAPRLPCYKLDARFADTGMVKRFLRSMRLGIYFRVLEEGVVRVGDPITCVEADPARFPVPALAELRYARPRDPATVERALSLSALPPDWGRTLRDAEGRGRE